MPAADDMLTLRPGRSLRLALILSLAHALAAISALVALPVWWWSALLGMTIVASLVAALRRHALRTAQGAVVEIALHRDGSARFTLRDGRVVDGRLHPGSFVAAALVIITLVTADRQRAISTVLAGDALSPEAFRRQRVWLRWMRSQAEPG